MSHKNDFKAFSISDNANVVSQERYEESKGLLTGFSPDNVPTHLLNKVLRQSSTISSVIADFIATQSGDDILDDGDIAKLTAQLNKALEQKFATEIPSASLIQKGVVQLTDEVGNSDTLAVTQKLAQEIVSSLYENINGRVPNSRKVNGKVLTEDINLNAADVGTYSREEIDRQNKEASNIPIGIPIPWPLPYPPIGYLTCNGAFFNKLQYPKLAEAYPDGRLPDLRGEFIRGWDDSRGADSGRGILSWQEGSYLVQEINNPPNCVVNFSLNNRVELNWDVPAENVKVNGRGVGGAGNWITDVNFFGVTRPRNVAFNYVVRATCSIMAEQKDSLESKVAVLGKDGLAEKAGWLTIYHAAPYSREFIFARPEYLMEGVGLPASSYIDAPELPDSDNKVVCRSEDGKYWEVVPDYRGTTAYSKETRLPVEVTEIGELSDMLTFKKPATHFDKWTGEEWIVDEVSVKASQIEQAEQQRNTLSQHANEVVTLLQHTVDVEMATEAEKVALMAWKKYFVLLSRVDILQAPDIEWPEQPSN
ncbi:Phage tail fibre repeat-containing protein [Photorhabdus luminescens]|uniref:Phage tail fibre repeat-containing protein n=2 Tax=Photorhabdus luminescens TaxID=29488 RepID=A0A1G5R3U5_PHOLU|nr:Phage tail fibre repeat-containing protein [Photorhabdus luminescens]